MSSTMRFVKPIILAAGLLASFAPAALASEDEIPDAELNSFGAELELAARKSEVDKLANAFDMKALVARAYDGLATATPAFAGLRQGTLSTMERSRNDLAQGFAKAASFEFLRLRRTKVGKRLIFRFQPATGVNYLAVACHRDSTGRLKICDYYSYEVGEHASALTRRMALSMMPSSIVVGGAGGFGKTNAEIGKNTALFEEAGQAIAAGKGLDAIMALKRLPKAVHTEKWVLARKLAAARTVNKDEYFKAFEEYRNHHPKDGALDLLSFDYYMHKEDAKELQAAVARLDARIGGDPYLMELSGGCLALMKRYDLALEELEKAIEQGRKSIGVRFYKLLALAGAKRYKEAAEYLDELENVHGLTIQFKKPEFEGFVKSEEYRKYLDKKSKKSKK